MKASVAIILAASLIPFEAVAQTVNCTTWGNTTTCTQAQGINPNSGPTDYWSHLDHTDPGKTFTDAYNGQIAANQAASRNQLMGRVSALVQAHQCDAARNEAIAAQDIDLAYKIQAVCVPAN